MELKTVNVSDLVYSDEYLFIRETARGYQYFVRYSYCREFYSTSRQEAARRLPEGVTIDKIAPKKTGRKS